MKEYKGYQYEQVTDPPFCKGVFWKVYTKQEDIPYLIYDKEYDVLFYIERAAALDAIEEPEPCEYCRFQKPSCISGSVSSEEHVVIDGVHLQAFYDGYYCNCDVIIKFCPMCGRKLC